MQEYFEVLSVLRMKKPKKKNLIHTYTVPLIRGLGGVFKNFIRKISLLTLPWLTLGGVGQRRVNFKSISQEWINRVQFNSLLANTANKAIFYTSWNSFRRIFIIRPTCWISVC